MGITVLRGHEQLELGDGKPLEVGFVVVWLKGMELLNEFVGVAEGVVIVRFLMGGG